MPTPVLADQGTPPPIRVSALPRCMNRSGFGDFAQQIPLKTHFEARPFPRFFSLGSGGSAVHSSEIVAKQVFGVHSGS